MLTEVALPGSDILCPFGTCTHTIEAGRACLRFCRRHRVHLPHVLLFHSRLATPSSFGSFGCLVGVFATAAPPLRLALSVGASLWDAQSQPGDQQRRIRPRFSPSRVQQGVAAPLWPFTLAVRTRLRGSGTTPWSSTKPGSYFDRDVFLLPLHTQAPSIAWGHRGPRNG